MLSSRVWMASAMLVWAVSGCAVEDTGPRYAYGTTDGSVATDATSYTQVDQGTWWTGSDATVTSVDASGECARDEDGFCIDVEPPLPAGTYSVHLIEAVITASGQQACGVMGAYACDPYIRATVGGRFYTSSVKSSTSIAQWGGEQLVPQVTSEDLLEGLQLTVMDKNPTTSFDTMVALCLPMLTESSLQGNLRVQCGGDGWTIASQAVVTIRLARVR